MAIKPVETVEVTQAIWTTTKRLNSGVDIIVQITGWHYLLKL